MKTSAVIFAAFFFFVVNAAWADTASHEAAARKVQKISFDVDVPRLLQAFSSGMGPYYSADEKDIILEAFMSSEMEAIYVQNLMKVYSESELVELAEMMSSPAYRIYVKRSPLFIQSLSVETVMYLRKSFPEIKRRAAEKRRLSGNSTQ